MTAHPLHTDSFSLYIKATILVSWVKCYNGKRPPPPLFLAAANIGFFPVRFRNKHPIFKTPFPQTTAAFKKLDGLVSAFRSSFPHEYRDPLGHAGEEGHHSFDPVLYSAHLLPHMCVFLICVPAARLNSATILSAMISLHEPYAIINSPICRSAAKLLESAKAILELTYAILSTSFDLSLLEYSASVRGLCYTCYSNY